MYWYVHIKKNAITDMSIVYERFLFVVNNFI